MASALRLCLLLLLAGLSCAGIPGQSEPPTILLFEVEPKTENGSRLYLTGSIHLGPEAGLDMDPQIGAAFGRSDAMVVEIDLSELEPAEVAQAMMDRGLLPMGVTLADRVAPETWALVEAALSDLGVAPANMSIFEPWVVALQISDLQFRSAGYMGEEGVDRHFLDLAHAAELPVMALETFDQQMGFFDELPPDVQESMLLDVLEGGQDLGAEADALVMAWEAGDEAALERIAFGPLEQHPEFQPLYETLYFARNERWAQQLEELTEQSGRTWFVVVGAAHLVGKRGIPSLLAERGFALKRFRRLR